MYSHLFSVTSDTQVMKSTNCYKICPLVRIGPYMIENPNWQEADQLALYKA